MTRPTINWYQLRSLIAAILVAMAVGLTSCDGANRTFTTTTPTPTYDTFSSNGCTTCDPQQKRIQATMTSSEAP